MSLRVGPRYTVSTPGKPMAARYSRRLISPVHACCCR